MDAICRASLPAYRLRATSDRTGNYGSCYNCPPGYAIPVHTRYRVHDAEHARACGIQDNWASAGSMAVEAD